MESTFSTFLKKIWNDYQSVAFRLFCLASFAFVVRLSFLRTPSYTVDSYTASSDTPVHEFLEVPQIIWGLNNQKIALARACLTARFLKRTLLMPSLSASLFYKEVERLQPLPFENLFKLDYFNAKCSGFVRIEKYGKIKNNSSVLVIEKGSGRKWTPEKDLFQLTQHINSPSEVIRITGKNPFLWHDHWPVKDYARVFECLELVEEMGKEVEEVVSKIKAKGETYVAVHMRVEIDWMIHCKKLEQRLEINEICSSKEEIMERVGRIEGLKDPTVVYLAVADGLLNDSSIFSGWREGLVALGKRELGVDGFYKKYPYLMQSAIDYEVCLGADVFVGNSFSTFSSLVVLQRTERNMKLGLVRSCGANVRWPSYAYNILGDAHGPKKWMTNMSDTTLKAISYGSNAISC